jgi:hypothetical protein
MVEDLFIEVPVNSGERGLEQLENNTILTLEREWLIIDTFFGIYQVTKDLQHMLKDRYPYKTLDLLAGTLHIKPSIMVSQSFGNAPAHLLILVPR